MCHFTYIQFAPNIAYFTCQDYSYNRLHKKRKDTWKLMNLSKNRAGNMHKVKVNVVIESNYMLIEDKLHCNFLLLCLLFLYSASRKNIDQTL